MTKKDTVDETAILDREGGDDADLRRERSKTFNFDSVGEEIELDDVVLKEGVVVLKRRWKAHKGNILSMKHMRSDLLMQDALVTCGEDKVVSVWEAGTSK